MQPERQTVTRKVGVCSHCGGAVLLHVRFGGVREAVCGCGATVIRPGFFAGAIASAVGRMRGEPR